MSVRESYKILANRKEVIVSEILAIQEQPVITRDIKRLSRLTVDLKKVNDEIKFHERRRHA